MGTSKSFGELAGKMEHLATVVPKATREGVRSGALATKQIIVTTAASRGVSPASKIAGSKWSVGFDIKGKYKPTALVRIRGPFQLVERDTKLHVIAARRLASRTAARRRLGEIALAGGGVSFGQFRNTKTGTGKKALVINGSPRAYAVHKGTKGKFIFRDSVTRAERVVPPIIRKRIHIDMAFALR
jgi:hypothetical protein